MSSPRCTNERATQSTPSRSTKSRSALSLSVSGPIGSTVSGRLMPLRLEMAPPTTTVASMRASVLDATVMRILPSSSSRVWPASTASKICGCGRNARAADPGLSVASKWKVAPWLRVALPAAISPIRNLGPCRSARMPIGRPKRASAVRTAACSFFTTSNDVWLMLMRNTSTPASKRRSIVSGAFDAGPSVATILTRRLRLIWLWRPLRWDRSGGWSSPCFPACRPRRSRCGYNRAWRNPEPP